MKFRPEPILIITTFLAAAGWVFSKEAIQGLPPFGFIGIRFIFASLCLLPFCFSALKKADGQDCFRSMGVGVLLAGSIFCWIYAISISDTLGEGAFIMSLSMLFVPLLAWPLFGSKPPRAFWYSLPIAFIGLFLLSWSDGWNIATSQLWFIAAAVGLATHFNFNSKYSASLPTILLTTLQLFTVGCLGVVLSFFLETWPEGVSLITWKWVLLSVLLATSLRYLMQTVGQKLVNPTNAAILMLLEPIWTMMLSVWVYDESMPLNKILGCALLLLSLFFYRFSQVRPKFRL
ncbi:DMT family transporter [Aliivibrio salmonicida]|jgi:drug/metabolite transporter (DMT)-like permease|uniref:Integral membrane protein, putative transmembrane transporter n=1 Tax=Aliivibrio salmonicida (strain LFI1238) TaxID=316275 RepID=B6ERT3_ALISL|nr:DMT family transporter [Aliivibrio salmonicida]AZL86768.1 DMT family transporter [Aliivibrio salmonicida]CAQ81417.1 integral membrane protein, putative transmembrane transporter [Aliivibrio salmonicida LFI1238]